MLASLSECEASIFDAQFLAVKGSSTLKEPERPGGPATIYSFIFLR